jgi:hypothetical protein
MNAWNEWDAQYSARNDFICGLILAAFAIALVQIAL